MSSVPSDSHVGARRRFLALALGLLDDDEEASVRAHLTECAPCDARWRTFSDEDERDEPGPRHIPPRMLARWPVAVRDLNGLEREMVMQHVAGCGTCRSDLAFLGHAPTLDRVADPPVAPSSARRVLDRIREVIALAVLEPLPVSVSRGSTVAADERTAGLDAYAGGDHVQAVELLESVLRSAPEDAEAALYLGSALMLSERTADAIPILEEAAARAPRGRAADELRWQLAQACLASGERALARRALEDVVTAGGRHREAARRLLDRLPSGPTA